MRLRNSPLPALVAALLLTACGPRAPAATGSARVRTVKATVPPAATTLLTDVTRADGVTVLAGAACAGGGTGPCQGFVARSRDGILWSRTDLGPIVPRRVEAGADGRLWLIAAPPQAACRSGCASVLLVSQDGGATWRAVDRTRAVTFLDVAFFPGGVGFALAARPQGCRLQVFPCQVLLQSRDGGRTWRDVTPTGTTAASFAFLDERQGFATVWACPGPQGPCQGRLVRTWDGGRSWTTVLTPVTTSTGNGGPFAVDVVDAAHGWLQVPVATGCSMGGCFGALLGTTDGGRHWTTLEPAGAWPTGAPTPWSSGFAGAAHFVTDEVGWIPVGAGAGPGVGGVLVTTDGGRHWRRIGAAPLWDIVALTATARFADALGDPKMGGPDFLVEVDVDGSWRQRLPAPVPTLALAFPTARQGVGLGLPTDPRAVLTTRDGGAHWQAVGELPAGAYPLDLDALDDRHLFADAVVPVGSGAVSALLESADGGRRWRVASSLAAPLTGALAFASPRRGFRVVAGGALEQTDDGGRHFRIVARAPAGVVFDTAVVFPAGVAYALSLGPKAAQLWVRPAGLGRWERRSRLPLSGKDEPIFVAAPAGAGLLLRTGVGDLWRSPDGGRTWTRLALGLTNVAPLLVAFADRRHGWLSTGDAVDRTADGGRTWTAVLRPW